MADRGALYIAFGERARAQAAQSIRTLRQHAPDLPVHVVGDGNIAGAEVALRPDQDAGARAYKTAMYTLSPFQQTLYLDADTEVRASPRAGFDLLGYVDLVLAQDVTRVLAQNHWPHLVAEEVAATRQALGTDQHMYFNSGVIFFNRNARVERMMAAWSDEWNRWGKHDQMALLRAIHQHPVRIAPMRECWNTHRAHQVTFVYHKHRQARRPGAPQ